MDDFDIEMGDAVDVHMEEEPQAAEILVGDDLQEDGEIDETHDGADDADAQRLVLNKVHIRGLDQLDENQLKGYISNHLGGKGADRIEWINDNSANLVFSTDSAAQEALLLLSAVEIADATQLPPLEVLPAKQITDRPEVLLQVRFAVASDRKERNAAQKSRFYLFHPEWDPETEEGRRRREGRDRRYRDREDRGPYRRGGRGRYDDQAQDRARNEENNSFDVDLYDDDPAALARRSTKAAAPARDGGRGGRRRRDSRSPSDDSRYDDDRGRRSTNRDKELFPGNRPRDTLRSERGSHARNRSASPARDDRDAMEDDLARDREAVRNNREKARSIKERIYSSREENSTKELFPVGGGGGGQQKELFPTKKELFPDSAGGGRAQMDQVSSADLISDNRNADNGAISIRGIARQSNDRGMLSIKGTAKSVRELFPDKFNSNGGNNRNNGAGGNAGKELFADRLEGRGRRRQKAGDLFD